MVQPEQQQQQQQESQSTFHLKQAPTPVGAYAHAKLAGGLLFLAGYF